MSHNDKQSVVRRYDSVRFVYVVRRKSHDDMENDRCGKSRDSRKGERVAEEKINVEKKVVFDVVGLISVRQQANHLAFCRIVSRP